MVEDMDWGRGICTRHTSEVALHLRHDAFTGTGVLLSIIELLLFASPSLRRKHHLTIRSSLVWSPCPQSYRQGLRQTSNYKTSPKMEIRRYSFRWLFRISSRNISERAWNIYQCKHRRSSIVCTIHLMIWSFHCFGSRECQINCRWRLQTVFPWEYEHLCLASGQ